MRRAGRRRGAGRPRVARRVRARAGLNVMRVGVVGATGLVGAEMLRVLDERRFPITQLRVYASPRSEGRRLRFGTDEVVCERLQEGCFDGLDLAIVDVDGPLAAEWAPTAVPAG